MKELDDFTVERLEQLINFTHENGTLHAIRTEWQALAKIALAVKTAEPVAYITFHEGRRAPDDYEVYLNAYTSKTDGISDDGTDAIPVYAAPVLNSPELPDGWIKCSERMPEVGVSVLIPSCGRYVFEAFRFEGNKFNRFGVEIVSDLWMPMPTPPTTEK